jgi:predicted dehydrogenase
MTVNAAQTKILVDLAIQKGLFLMEAVWTRYMPLVQEVTKIVQDGKLGTVWRVFADLSGYHDLDGDLWDGTRLVELDLAGGAMLDREYFSFKGWTGVHSDHSSSFPRALLYISNFFKRGSTPLPSCLQLIIHPVGIYSITWIFQILYHINAAAQSHTPIVASSMSKYAKTGSDESTSMLITFPPTNTVGIATTHLRVSDNPDNVETAGTPIRIQGSKGEIQVYGPAFRPERYRIIPAAGNEHGELKGGEVKHEIEGRGMYWEADECARCLRDGRKESEGMGWAESLAVMGVMDQAREQNGLKYPDRIESVEYPLEGFGL